MAIFGIIKNMELGTYKHCKGGIYEVIGVAHHSETLEELVVYKAAYDGTTFGRGSLWVRPKKMFLENVIINNIEVPRFELIKSK